MYKVVADKGAESFANLVYLGGPDEAEAITVAWKLIASLYDPKGKETPAHISMEGQGLQLKGILLELN